MDVGNPSLIRLWKSSPSSDRNPETRKAIRLWFDECIGDWQQE